MGNNHNNYYNNNLWLKVHDGQRGSERGRVPVSICLQRPSLQLLHNRGRILTAVVRHHHQQLLHQQPVGQLRFHLPWSGFRNSARRSVYDRVGSDPELAVRLPFPPLGQDLLDLHHRRGQETLVFNQGGQIRKPPTWKLGGLQSCLLHAEERWQLDRISLSRVSTINMIVLVLHVLEQVQHLGRDHLHLLALRGFLLVNRLELSRNAFALAVLDHVAQGSQLGLGHDAFSGGLQVGGLLVVHVAAQAACQVPQSPLEGLDLHSLVVSQDSHAVLQREDLEDAVLVENHPVALVLKEGGPAGHLGHGLHDLSVDLQGSSGAAPAASDQLKLVLVVVDDSLDNVLGGGLLQSDHDLGVGGAVPEGHMLAVVEGVVVHHLVEGPHLVVLDGAGGGKAVLGHPLDGVDK